MVSVLAEDMQHMGPGDTRIYEDRVRAGPGHLLVSVSGKCCSLKRLPPRHCLAPTKQTSSL